MMPVPRRGQRMALAGSAWLLLIPFVCVRADQPASAQPATAGTERPISHWIDELDSTQFLRRQAASQRLLEFGPEAVEPLAEATRRGRLELTERAVTILQSMALKQSPEDEGGAMGALNRLVSQGSGSASLRAKTTLDEIRREREQQAIAYLGSAGVKLGYREFVIDARALNDNVVLIDDSWNGDVAALRWLRWLGGVRYVVAQGSAVQGKVLEHVVRMPDVTTIILREAMIVGDIFTPLSRLSRIDELEFRYIRLTTDDAEKLAKLPIRIQLTMIATDVPVAKVNELRTALPGLNIVYRQGGFLGVRCNNLTPECQIDSVLTDGAAEKAGLMPGDVIESINGVKIARFEDLQIQVGQHSAGDEIEIAFDRRGEKSSVKVTLQRMLDQ